MDPILCSGSPERLAAPLAAANDVFATVQHLFRIAATDRKMCGRAVTRRREYEVTELHSYAVADGHRLPHDPFKAIVAPRPIGWVSTVDGEGRVNLAPYSFFNAVASRPPCVVWSSEGWKDSVANAEATRAFTWNLATRALAERMNETSAMVAPDVDEFGLAGLTAVPSVAVAPPRVGESPAALECVVTDIVRLRTAAGEAMNNWLVVGEVVHVHLDPAFLTPDGLFDLFAARPILRAGYRADYAEIGPEARFVLRRPTG
jgi:flavin reductase (DIM6/NTAB) family NADH-FMN oxidoreductase RutF